MWSIQFSIPPVDEKHFLLSTTKGIAFCDPLILIVHMLAQCIVGVLVPQRLCHVFADEHDLVVKIVISHLVIFIFGFCHLLTIYE